MEINNFQINLNIIKIRKEKELLFIIMYIKKAILYLFKGFYYFNDKNVNK